MLLERLEEVDDADGAFDQHIHELERADEPVPHSLENADDQAEREVGGAADEARDAVERARRLVGLLTLAAHTAQEPEEAVLAQRPEWAEHRPIGHGVHDPD